MKLAGVSRVVTVVVIVIVIVAGAGAGTCLQVGSIAPHCAGSGMV